MAKRDARAWAGWGITYFTDIMVRYDRKNQPALSRFAAVSDPRLGPSRALPPISCGARWTSGRSRWPAVYLLAGNALSLRVPFFLGVGGKPGAHELGADPQDRRGAHARAGVFQGFRLFPGQRL